MNHCYIFIGPSGSGKTTLASAVFDKQQKIISCTSRPPRLNEQDGVDYYFLTSQAFQEKIQSNAFIEWDRYGENYYGTLLQTFQNQLEKSDCFNVLTAEGFWALRNLYGERIVPVFIHASPEILFQRLMERKESSTVIHQRSALFEKDLRELNRLKQLPDLIMIDNSGSLEASVDKLIKAFH